MKNDLLISVLVPANNEEKNIPIIINKFKKLIINRKECFEIIFVDDGSTDNTWSVLKENCNGTVFKCLRNKKNLGISISYKNALDISSGKYLIFFTADLQSDPETDIPKLLEKKKKGYDVVCAERINRTEKYRNIISTGYNFLLRFFFKTTLKDHNFIILIDADFKKYICLKPDWHRFLVPVLKVHGARITSQKIRENKRIHGRSHFSISYVFKTLYNLIEVYFYCKKVQSKKLRS